MLNKNKLKLNTNLKLKQSIINGDEHYGERKKKTNKNRAYGSERANSQVG